MADNKLYISKVQLPNDTSVYYIKDAEAREMIALIEGGTLYIGDSTAEIKDEGTQNPVIDGTTWTSGTKTDKTNHKYGPGALVTYSKKEFIWDGAKWRELGDLSGLGDLAYKNSASGTYQKATGASASFSGKNTTVTISKSTDTTVEEHTFTPAGSISVGAGTANYTPSGSISKATFTGTPFESTGSFTPEGTVSITAAASESGNYTPAGSISGIEWKGTNSTFNGTYVPEGSVSIAANKISVSGNTDYTPEGTVSQPNFTNGECEITTSAFLTGGSVGTPDVTPTDASALKSAQYDKMQATYTEGTELLTFSYASNTNCTTTDAKFLTGVSVSAPSFSPTMASTTITGTASGIVSQPSFTGTAGSISITSKNDAPVDATFTGTNKNVSVSGTPNGSITDQGSFTGTKVLISGSFEGSAKGVTVSGTATGNINDQTFTGTGVELKFTGSEKTLSHTVTQATYTGSCTPLGDVSVTIANSDATVTVS